MKHLPAIFILNGFGVLVLAFSTALYHHRQLEKVASFVSDSHRNDIVVQDFQSVSRGVSAIRDMFVRVDVSFGRTITLYDSARAKNPMFRGKIETILFRDRDNSHELARISFYFDYLSPFLTGCLIWFVISLFASPTLLVLLKKHELNRVKAKEAELELRFSAVAKQVAHDIRSPVSALQMAVATLPKEASEHAELISRAATRIGRIADELLKQEKGERVLAVSEGFVSEVITEIVSEKESEFKNRGVTFEFTLTDPTLKIANADTLKRVLSNLLNNAVDSIERDGTVKITAETAGAFTVISVIDNGRGIPTEVLRKLGKKRISYGKSGSGLGIMHANKVIQEAGGKLNVTSNLGFGTQVTLRVPRIRPTS